MRKCLFAFILAAGILLSGCMAVKYDHVIERDGTSSITEEVDMSELFSRYEDIYESMGEELADTDAFKNMTRRMHEICSEARAQGAECTYSETDYIVTLKKDSLTPEDAGYEFEKRYEFPNVVYVFRADRAPELGIEFGDDGDTLFDSSTSDEVSGKFDDPESKSSVASLKMMGIEFDYVITMPGEITEAKNGDIDDEGRAVYDVLELMEEGETIEVTSQEMDPVGSLCGAPALALASVLLLAAFARRG